MSEGTVAPGMAENLDFFNGYAKQMSIVVPRFINTNFDNTNAVPKPGSSALLAIGAIGAVGVARRRKAAK